jgi:hypothetical protein
MFSDYVVINNIFVVTNSDEGSAITRFLFHVISVLCFNKHRNCSNVSHRMLTSIECKKSNNLQKLIDISITWEVEKFLNDTNQNCIHDKKVNLSRV